MEAGRQRRIVDERENGFFNSTRDRAGRTQAANRERVASEQASHDRDRLEAAQRQSSSEALALQQARNQALREGLSLQQAELDILKAQNERRMSTVQRFAHMGIGQFRQSEAALAMVNRAGVNANRLPEHVLRQAEMIDPYRVNELLLPSAERNARRLAQGNQVSEQFREDWRNGVSLAEGFREQQRMSNNIRQQSDAIAVEGANQMANALQPLIDSLVENFQRRMQAMEREVTRRFSEMGNRATPQS
jgi:hypothetical protein